MYVDHRIRTRLWLAHNSSWDHVLSDPSSRVKNLQNRTLLNHKVWSLKKLGTICVRLVFRTIKTYRNPFKDPFRHKKFLKLAVPNSMTFLHAIEACNNRLNRPFNQLFFWCSWKKVLKFQFLCFEDKNLDQLYQKHNFEMQEHLQSWIFQL